MVDVRDETKIQLAFQRVQIYNPMSWILRLRCGKYIHVELIFPEPYIYVTNSFSSRITGPRFKKIKYNNRYWDFVTLDKKYQDDILLIRERCFSIVKVLPKYDFVGAVFEAGYDIPLEIRERWYCSELIAYILGIKKYGVDPVELFYILTKLKC